MSEQIERMRNWLRQALPSWTLPMSRDEVADCIKDFADLKERVEALEATNGKLRRYLDMKADDSACCQSRANYHAAMSGQDAEPSSEAAHVIQKTVTVWNADEGAFADIIVHTGDCAGCHGADRETRDSNADAEPSTGAGP